LCDANSTHHLAHNNIMPPHLNHITSATSPHVSNPTLLQPPHLSHTNSMLLNASLPSLPTHAVF
jgi:hypothetical protein